MATVAGSARSAQPTGGRRERKNTAMKRQPRVAIKVAAAAPRFLAAASPLVAQARHRWPMRVGCQRVVGRGQAQQDTCVATCPGAGSPYTPSVASGSIPVASAARRGVGGGRGGAGGWDFVPHSAGCVQAVAFGLPGGFVADV